MFGKLNRPASASDPNLASSRTFRLLASCLMLLLLPQLPAFAQTPHVHHLWYNNSNWQDQDLTALTGAPELYGVSQIAAFYTTPNHQFHVFYSDVNSHIHQLYYNNTSWSDTDLTALTGGADAGAGGSGFAIGNSQYVFYVGLYDTHVHELSYIDNWTDQDITAQVAGAPLAGFGSFVAFATKPNNQFHVYYPDRTYSPGHLHQLYFNGTSWSDADLTAITGAICEGSEWSTGFATGNLQHILCPGYHGTNPGYFDLLHIYYNNDTWVYEDITEEAGGAQLPIYASTGQAGFAVGREGEVYGIPVDTDVYQYTYKNGKWDSLDLTAYIGAPQNIYCDAMVGFPTTPNNQFHIYYAPSSLLNQSYADVYQLYFNGTTWAVNDLTAGVSQAYLCTGMAGFAIGNLQHVFYFGIEN